MNTLENLYEYSFTPSESEVEYFKNIFTKYGSDKARPHTYQDIYSALFEDKDSVKNIIEMGVYRGGSLRAYSEIFNNANIFGMDIDAYSLFDDERIKCFWADQASSSSINDVRNRIGDVQFDLIVDDGCHMLAETVNTFQTMLPWLAVGGWFVVEDIKIQFENNWKNIAGLLSENYESFLIVMNKGNYDIESGLEMSDNTVLVVHRKS